MLRRVGPVGLDAIVTRAVDTAQPLIKERAHRLAVSLPKEAVWLDGDEVRLAQVIGNLLCNAAKYTEPSGEIRLSAAVTSDQVAIRVSDTGMGIEADVLPHIFDMFTQAESSLGRAAGGLGIGLSLSRSLVEMHNGRITAQSDGRGCGSEFIVELPRCKSPPDTAIQKWSPKPTPRLRVLVVEDNPGTARIVAQMLTKFWGHEVEIAHDGPAALELATRFLPELILLDIGLPGMTGYDVARRLRVNPLWKRFDSSVWQVRSKYASGCATTDYKFVITATVLVAIRAWLDSIRHGQEAHRR